MVQIGDKVIIGNSEDIFCLIKIEILDVYEISTSALVYATSMKCFLEKDPLIYNSYKKRNIKANLN